KAGARSGGPTSPTGGRRSTSHGRCGRGVHASGGSPAPTCHWPTGSRKPPASTNSTNSGCSTPTSGPTNSPPWPRPGSRSFSPTVGEQEQEQEKEKEKEHVRQARKRHRHPVGRPQR